MIRFSNIYTSFETIESLNPLIICLQMTVKPVNETDYYGKGFEELSHARKFVGPPRMNFGADRGDCDRLEKATAKQAYIDSVPTDPEWTIW